MTSIATHLLKHGTLSDATRAFVLNSVKINAQNICDYFMTSPQREFSYQRDLPNLAPPFRQMWFEYMVAEKKVAVAVSAVDLREESDAMHLDGCRWLLELTIMVLYDDGYVQTIARTRWPIQGDGALSLEHSRIIEAEPSFLEGHPYLEKLGKQDLATRLIAPAMPALLALSFMNCRNVEMADTNKPRRRLGKRRHRRKPRCEWKVLVINPMTKVLDKAGRRGDSLAARLHICRGHFKDYRESGLFGRHRGVYWWHSHVRGDETEGTIHKTYEVRH